MPNTSQQLISDYVDWFKNKYSIKQLENADEIVTPFVNHLNDRIRLYIELKANNTIRISDDGNTFNELAMYGLDIKTNTRQKLIHNTLSNFGIQLDDDILYVEATIKDFPLKKNIQLQISSDLCFLLTHSVCFLKKKSQLRIRSRFLELFT